MSLCEQWSKTAGGQAHDAGLMSSGWGRSARGLAKKFYITKSQHGCGIKETAASNERGNDEETIHGENRRYQRSRGQITGSLII